MKKAEEFIKQLISIRDYWLNESRAETAKDKVDGFIFSMLVMFDGDSGANDFHSIELTDVEDGESINECDCLHETFCRLDK